MNRVPDPARAGHIFATAAVMGIVFAILIATLVP